MIHTDMLPDMASTFINIYRQQGQLPVWHLMGNETNCMVGNPGSLPRLAHIVVHVEHVMARFVAVGILTDES